MQCTGCRVPVVNGRQMMLFEKVIKIADKTRQIGRVNRGVLNDCNRFTVTWYIGQKTECRFTEVPDAALISSPDNGVVIAEAGRTQFRFELCNGFGYLLFVGAR